jgi:hypothetical protein
MSEFTGGFVFFLALAVVMVVSFSVGADATESKVSRNCSLTGTYVIDNDTVIVCRVVKRGEPSTVSKKPEEQSL